MVCKPDNNLVFEEEEFYTAFCDVCNCWVKIYKFRGCEERHKALEAKGVDIFKELREIEKIASFQMGEAPSILSSQKPNKPTKPSRRGR